MFSCYVFWAVISLSGFLTDFHVFGCDDNCTDKPVFNPPRLAVKFGTSASANCSVCQHACHNKLFGLEKSIGKIQRDGTTILWTVDKMEAYPTSVVCYYNNGNGSHCCSTLPITVYHPPTEVKVGFVRHSRPMVEREQFALYCRVKEVAPLKNVILTLYQGENAVFRQHFKNITGKKPTDGEFIYFINATKENDGAQYMCHAQLDMRPDSVLYSAQSSHLIVDVHYKPHFNGPANEQISLTVGDPLHLNCSARGNPRPWVTWTLPSAATFEGDVFSVDSVTTEHRGLYICSFSDSEARLDGAGGPPAYRHAVHLGFGPIVEGGPARLLQAVLLKHEERRSAEPGGVESHGWMRMVEAREELACEPLLRVSAFTPFAHTHTAY